ncbi:excinuclease ABC subunit UvrC [Gordonia pseudamarae]|uniref:UvrABC system protein C n=1 Tax=Gordonia pseudamarae TaxID=2831662 RepID=A0ABX6IHU0_9ACTN|nr:MULTISPECIES: excinuclease ABC subunit UvrC [Gordonia]MBD0021271.1 excinuclease ABC subunit UvrC [Gordonia sp. (in: high G+C Gram-positive bacteria)]QHN26541.1 excinuclease ABC subunit UvrC [Gordonia pseudamarae]QHN35434.1 excinuclease ABC subunit UvrC [Gordonia pseudamarae]
MADPSTYRPAPGTIPTDPGVYKFRDAHRRVIYVGKAKNLRSRLTSYFADVASLHPRTRQMVTSAASVEWTVVGTEVEALQLEYNWIKEFDPRFNVRYRDDKTYPVLAVTLNEEYPRLAVYRGHRTRGVRYFGPYSHAWAIRETVDLLTRVFPARTCTNGVFKRHRQMDRPCLLGYIDKCSAPCVGRVSAGEHRRIVDDFCDFLAGRTDQLINQIEREMSSAAEELDFEKAARLRDDATALRRAMEKQAVVFGDGTDADVIAVDSDDLEMSVQVFHVRGGRVRGQRGWVVERFDSDDDGEVIGQFLTQFYGGQADMETGESIPREVLVPAVPGDVGKVTDWLTDLRGSRVAVRVPQRGDKRALMETVARNASESLAQHKLRRAGDLTTRSAALTEIQQALGLDEAPLRIECVDISHVQGTDVVASLVVFEDGLPRKSDYRHYSIKEAAGEGHSDDVGSIAEVTRRRFLRHRADREPVVDPESGKARRFAYPPNLFVVDGGQPQVQAAAAVFDELGITDVAVVGLAKRLEEIWLPDDDDPVILPRSSEALFLLQRVRDEAHRFAITFHRSKRSKRMTASVLDAIPGLGQVRRTALVSHFGSVAKLREASVEEISAVPGIGVATATAVRDALAAGNGHDERGHRPQADLARAAGGGVVDE